MSSTNSPLITPLRVRDSSADAMAIDHRRMAELRKEMEGLTRSISEVTSKRVTQIEQLSSAGVASLHGTIATQPWAALGVAVVAGALLAAAIVPRRSREFRYNDPAAYNSGDIAATVRKAVSRSVDTQPFTSRFERMVDSISNLDASAVTSSPAFGTAKTWMQALISGFRKT
ncbi:MAG: hypothetical protein ABL894_10010 [Hyphomicrobium sp.]